MIACMYAITPIAEEEEPMPDKELIYRIEWHEMTIEPSAIDRMERGNLDSVEDLLQLIGKDTLAQRQYILMAAAACCAANTSWLTAVPGRTFEDLWNLALETAVIWDRG